MNRFFRLICFVAIATTVAVSAGPTEPEIDIVRGREVKVRVPAGFDRVTLQQRVTGGNRERVRGSDRWKTISTKYPRGAEGMIRFQLDRLVGPRFLRVYGTRSEPLSGSLLTGLTNFLPDPPDDAAIAGSGGERTPGGTLSLGTGNTLTTDLTGGNAGARTVTESDIWKVQGDRLYFYNELRGLQVFDLAKPDKPTLLGTLRMPGSGEEMYLLGSTHAVLLKQASNFWYGGNIYYDALPGGAVMNLGTNTVAASRASIAINPRATAASSSEIVIVDVHAGAPQLVARVPFDGSLAESRLVGNVLYVASNVSHAATDSTAAEYGLQLTSFDLSDPENPLQRGAIYLGGWANAVSATDRFFLVAKYAVGDGSWSHNSIDLIDISAPDGTMSRAGAAQVVGNIDNKFEMNISGDVLTAVAQAFDEVNTGTDAKPVMTWSSITKVQTFSIADPSAPAVLGSLSLAPGESVRATRFDGELAYVVTFRQIDPLFVVDLADPANPSVSGHVEAPGFSTYIEPLGDRLVTIGLVDWRPAVSLFDVSDASSPKLLSQVKVGPDRGWSSSEAVWNEKAFKVLPDENLIMVPVSGSNDDGNGWFSSVQLIDLFPGKLVKRGAIVHPFSPRRATLVKDCIVAISPTRLVSVDAADRDKPVVKADLEIARRVDRVFRVGRFLVQLGGSAEWSVSEPPTISISAAKSPDEIVSAVNLDNVPVVGATVVDNVLYIAQAQGGYYYSANGQTDSEGRHAMIVSAYDLASLPVLLRVGSVKTNTKLTGSELAAHWPSPGILVWSGSGGYREWSGDGWYDPGPYRPVRLAATAAGGDVTAVDLSGYWTTRWFYAETTRLVAFDFTRPQSPKFLSDIELGNSQAWQLSQPFDGNGMLYLSYKYLGGIPSPAVGTVKEADPGVPRINRHFLVRVDYADPAAPVVDDTQINLPGVLRGVARKGQVLFTLGQDYDLSLSAPKSGQLALHASAFDGTAAYLLDTLPLPSLSTPLVIDGTTIFTLDAQPAQIWVSGPFDPNGGILAAENIIGDRWWWGGGTWKDNDKLSVFAIWSFGEDGKFAHLGAAETGHDTALFTFDKLAVTQDSGRTLHLFDVSAPGQIGNIGSYTFEGSVWPDVSHASGGLTSGLWVPLGQYGVEVVAAPAK